VGRTEYSREADMVSAAGGRRPGWMYCRWCGGPVSRVAAPAVGRGCSQL